MAESMITSERKPVNPSNEAQAAIEQCKAMLARATAAADWRRLVAECAARGLP